MEARDFRIMYMNQSQSYIEILLKADGIHDFIEKQKL